MTRSKALGLFLFACLLGLVACTHSRVVRRDYDYDNAPIRQSSADRSASRSLPRPSIAPIPSGAMHVVRPGETLYGISFRYGLRYQDLAAWNGIGDPYVIEIGQQLRLVPPRGGIVSSRPARLPAPGLPAPANVRPIPATPMVAPSQPPVPTIATPMTSSSMAWRWPTRGEIIGRYVTGDRTRQGIDIAGTAGQNVTAAADGVVIFSGAGLVGYGELIIIKHSDEWLSAYGHNRRRLVAEGTRVKAGEVIAELGRTGAPREMLHFEIRRNGKPVDPLALLPSP